MWINKIVVGDDSVSFMGGMCNVVTIRRDGYMYNMHLFIGLPDLRTLLLNNPIYVDFTSIRRVYFSKDYSYGSLIEDNGNVHNFTFLYKQKTVNHYCDGIAKANVEYAKIFTDVNKPKSNSLFEQCKEEYKSNSLEMDKIEPFIKKRILPMAREGGKCCNFREDDLNTEFQFTNADHFVWIFIKKLQEYGFTATVETTAKTWYVRVSGWAD